jgi:hypothetical protein
MITFSQLGNYGRLGNQLFQIAAVLGAAYKTGNLAGFAERWTHEFDVNPISGDYDFTILREQHFHFDESIWANISRSSHVDLHGYFQSERYFEFCPAYVHNCILSLKNMEIRQAQGKKYGVGSNWCAIHIRRGDYVNLPHHYIDLSRTGYYQRAYNYIKDKADKIIVFSDDIGWCKQHLTQTDKIVFSENTNPMDDMMLMSLCRCHVIANSSFSWWGSWLARNVFNDTITIAPNQWFGPAIQHNTRDLYRKDMLIM